MQRSQISFYKVIVCESGYTVHVAVVVTESLSFAKSDSINDTGMVQSIRDDCILVCQDSLKDAGVGVEAGCIQDSILGAIELGDLILEFLVNVLATVVKASMFQG